MAVAMVSAVRGGRLPSLHHHHRRQMILSSTSSSIIGSWGSLKSLKQLICSSNSRGFTLFARYSQTQDLYSSRLQDRFEDLPKLVEDILQTSVSTGPRGALRMVQGIQAFIGVGGEWLADVSKSANSSAGLPTQLQLGLLSPLYLRKLFECMGQPTLSWVSSLHLLQHCSHQNMSKNFRTALTELLQYPLRRFKQSCVRNWGDQLKAFMTMLTQPHSLRPQ